MSRLLCLGLILSSLACSSSVNEPRAAAPSALFGDTGRDLDLFDGRLRLRVPAGTEAARWTDLPTAGFVRARIPCAGGSVFVHAYDRTERMPAWTSTGAEDALRVAELHPLQMRLAGERVTSAAAIHWYQPHQPTVRDQLHIARYATVRFSDATLTTVELGFDVPVASAPAPCAELALAVATGLEAGPTAGSPGGRTALGAAYTVDVPAGWRLRVASQDGSGHGRTYVQRPGDGAPRAIAISIARDVLDDQQGMVDGTPPQATILGQKARFWGGRFSRGREWAARVADGPVVLTVEVLATFDEPLAPYERIAASIARSSAPPAAPAANLLIPQLLADPDGFASVRPGGPRDRDEPTHPDCGEARECYRKGDELGGIPDPRGRRLIDIACELDADDCMTIGHRLEETGSAEARVYHARGCQRGSFVACRALAASLDRTLAGAPDAAAGAALLAQLCSGGALDACLFVASRHDRAGRAAEARAAFEAACRRGHWRSCQRHDAPLESELAAILARRRASIDACIARVAPGTQPDSVSVGWDGTGAVSQALVLPITRYRDPLAACITRAVDRVPAFRASGAGATLTLD